MSHTKPILCIDFDGVIHSYTSGWKGVDVIPDDPVEGAVEFIIAAQKFFRVSIYSTRSGVSEGRKAMRCWLLKHWPYSEEDFDLVEWPEGKPSALVTLDDRALTFTGEWPEPSNLIQFKPWNKK